MPSKLTPQWPFGNLCAWAHDVHHAPKCICCHNDIVVVTDRAYRQNVVRNFFFWYLMFSLMFSVWHQRLQLISSDRFQSWLMALRSFMFSLRIYLWIHICQYIHKSLKDYYTGSRISHHKKPQKIASSPLGKYPLICLVKSLDSYWQNQLKISWNLITVKK